MLLHLVRIVPKPPLHSAGRVHRQYSTLMVLPRSDRRQSSGLPTYRPGVRNPQRLSVRRLPTTYPSLSAAFHSTPRNQGLPVIAFFASIFKASTGLEIARIASRIALTFIPLIWLKNKKSQRIIKYAALHGFPASEEHKQKHLTRIRRRTLLLQTLLAIPVLIFWATIVGSLEQTPLTGRWRMILLSPEEEDEIAAKLAGVGWYNAVGEILAEEGSPRVLPPSDWRYQWVNDTLRRLESSIPVLAREQELCPNWTEGREDSIPLPPPAEYPLRPRPRASEYLRWLCDKMAKGDKSSMTTPGGTIPGAPYSLLVVEHPECSNAFSYGFGPDGGSGIVVYSGFLDDIFGKYPAQYEEPPPAPKSFWQTLFGGLFSATPSRPAHPTPTEEQTAELAILLAHEMAHLLLSHHLESLSGANVIVPGALSIVADIIRVVIFPVTMFFGPFVNDAVAGLGKVGSGEVMKISELCSSTKQEIEADVVSARLLAHAGFDARGTIRFWEHRSGGGAECAKPGGKAVTVAAEPNQSTASQKVARQIMGDQQTHPVGELRVNHLKEELSRWESERRKAITQASKPG